MLNDRDDDKYEGHEESEYHFSEDDATYEVETEESKPAAPAQQPTTAPKESMVARLSRSKRMLISGAIFLVLIFVVYKMVSPTNTVPTTDITPTIAQTTTTKNVAVSTKAQPSSAVVNQTTTTASQTAVSVPENVGTLAPPTVTNPAVENQSAATMGQNPAVLTDQNAPVGVQQPVNNQQATAPVGTSVQTEQAPPVGVNMPGVIPVQSTTANQQNVGQSGVGPIGTSTVQTEPSSSLDNMQATSSELSSQLQAQYEQKLSEYQMQNKVLQTEVQTLNTRVASMEAQMNELVKALTRQAQASAGAPDVGMQGGADNRAAEGRETYNVQAIIPGRAWLKTDSGETVTVAEGDQIKGLGRVTKIDPYDGVVVVNTGTKTISLSYGNGT